MYKIQYCYSAVSPESAEQGEQAEHGFWEHGGYTYPVGGCEVDPADCIDVHSPGSIPAPSQCETLEDAVLEIFQVCGFGEVQHTDTEVTFYGVDPTVNFRTGMDTTYSAHIKGAKQGSSQAIGGKVECKITN